MSGIGGRFYDENEAEEILRLAASDGGAERMNRERLLSMAAELGISPEAVERAEKELVVKKQEEAEAHAEARDREEFRKRRIRNLVSSLGSWISVNALMVGIWFLSGEGDFWPAWVMLATSFGFLPRALHSLGRGTDDEFRRWRRRKRGLVDEPRREKIRDILDELAPRQDIGRIEVIRELRARTGLPLSDARQAVTDYAAEHDGTIW